jgi:hypothetical protein
MLNGVEIDLGLTDDDSMPARVEALRIYLEEHLGFDSFVRVYQLMEGVSQEDDEVRYLNSHFARLCSREESPACLYACLPAIAQVQMLGGVVRVELVGSG